MPVIDGASQFNISPYSVSQGAANYAGLLPRNEEGAHIFATTGSNGVGMGDDSLLADKYGVTTDRFVCSSSRPRIPGSLCVLTATASVCHRKYMEPVSPLRFTPSTAIVLSPGR